MISENMNTVRALDPTRAQIDNDVAEFLRRGGKIRTEPGFERFADKPPTMRRNIAMECVANSDKKTSTAWSRDGKHNERNKVRMTIPLVTPDHQGNITLSALNHLFKKSGIKKRRVADALNMSPGYISNICNDKQSVTQVTLRLIVACIHRLMQTDEERQNGQG